MNINCQKAYQYLQNIINTTLSEKQMIDTDALKKRQTLVAGLEKILKYPTLLAIPVSLDLSDGELNYSHLQYVDIPLVIVPYYEGNDCAVIPFSRKKSCISSILTVLTLIGHEVYSIHHAGIKYDSLDILRTPEPTSYEIKLFDPLDDVNFALVSIDHIHQYTQKDPDSQIQDLIEIRNKIIEDDTERKQKDIERQLKNINNSYSGLDSNGNPYSRYFPPPKSMPVIPIIIDSEITP